MRIENWYGEYGKAVAAVVGMPFEWGVHDCVTFAARVVDAISDLAVTASFRAKYQWNSKETAYAIISQAGGLEALVVEFLGDPVPWSRLSTGDIVLAIQSDGSEIICVHDGHNLIAPGAVGVISVRLSAAVKGWSI